MPTYLCHLTRDEKMEAKRENIKRKVVNAGRHCCFHFPHASVELLIIILLTIFFNNPLHAQDIHFSQIDVNPIIYNPAYTGFFDGGIRIGVAYRNQWASVSRAFQTVAATAECALLRRRYYGDGLSVGVMLYNDRAGTLQYGSTVGNLSLGYFKAIGNKGNNFISLAIQGGGGQAGFNTAEIDMEDPSDLIEKTSATFVTIAAGAAWFYQPNDDLYFKFALAGHNLNNPDISYLSMDNARIERRFSGFARAEYRAWSNISLMPIATHMWQKNYHETLIGCDVKWYVSESTGNILNFSGGIHYRWRDAALVELLAEWNSFIFAITYDANISKLTPASKSIGSFEIGIVYRTISGKHVKRKALPCPVM